MKSLTGGKTKVLHRNLLLPLQGRVRQEGETVEERVTDSEEEEEEGAVIPQVARAPKGSPRSTTKPQDSPTPVESSASSLTDLSPPESISGDEDSNGENAFGFNTESLTSHTTASSSTSAHMLSAEASSNIPHSITESQFSPVMPYVEDSGQTSSNVFIETSTTIDPHTSQQIPQSPDTSKTSIPTGMHNHNLLPPRRSARSTKGAPPVCFGKVITHGTRITNMFDNPVYRQTLFVSSIPNIILG